MIALAIAVTRFVRELRSALRDPGFRGLALFVVVLLLSGSLFYVVVEGWRFLDAFVTGLSQKRRDAAERPEGRP
jgi:hypothetical protein